MEKRTSRQTEREMYSHDISCQQIIPKIDKLRNNSIISNNMDLATKQLAKSVKNSCFWILKWGRVRDYHSLGWVVQYY